VAREKKSNPRKMRPQFLVLCEGETEENYIHFLRQNYRLPIKIIPKVVGNKISSIIIKRYKKELIGPENSIKTFLMYDADRPEVLSKLSKCDEILLISKPCIEIWFIAHYQVPTETEISSSNCVKQLKSIKNWENYKKSILTSVQELELWNKRFDAVTNMESKSINSKTFSSIFELIKILEEESRKKLL